MSYFASDQDISVQHYNNVEVPGPNTLDQSANDSLKVRCQDFVKWRLGLSKSDSDPTDNFGTYKEAFLRVYGLFIDEEDNPFTKENIDMIDGILFREKGANLVVTNQWKDMFGYKLGNDFE